MADSIVAQIKQLQRMSVPDLRQRYEEIFGEETRSNNKDWLWKRIAYRLQERAEGSLSERARRRAAELADEAYLRTRPQEGRRRIITRQRDPRLPDPGTVLVREFHGERHEVTVLEDGFSYLGHRYGSLSAVARRISNQRWNGYLFFGLTKEASV